MRLQPFRCSIRKFSLAGGEVHVSPWAPIPSTTKKKKKCLSHSNALEKSRCPFLCPIELFKFMMMPDMMVPEKLKRKDPEFQANLCSMVKLLQIN